ncbi:MAG: Lrp/AsnC family transcriptional regulator [Candidatus Micrarchaeales archaeon]|nr:Lrp/AsnC family transcriptional regulator [Candidatus Micrarchaeales archaeon]
MKAIPQIVESAFEKLRKQYPFYVALAKINGKYYIYRRSSRWDKVVKKRKSVSEYLGRIEEDGSFIKKQKREETVVSNQKSNEPDHANAPMEIVSRDLELLQILSMNARADISYLGKKILGYEKSETYYRIKQLEKNLDLRYFAEIDVEKLGYLRFLIMVKFTENFPKLEELKAILEREPLVQLAVITKGDYDLIIYALAKNTGVAQLLDTVISLRKGELAKYKSIWKTTLFEEHFGYIPIRQEFIDSIKKELLKRDYAVITELISNGAEGFTEIDKKYRFDAGRAAYTYHKLRERGIIKRITVSMQNIPVKYTGIIIKEIIDEGVFRANREKSLLDIVEKTNSVLGSKYILTGNIGNPDGSMLFMPIFNENEFDKEIEKLASLNLGLSLKPLLITSLVLGSFCYRRFDLAYADQYKPLIEQFGAERPQQIDYESSARIRKSKKRRREIAFDITSQEDEDTEMQE